MFCARVDGKTTEIIKILKLVREFRVKRAKMLKGSVSGQIFQPAENSSGSFLSLSGRSRHSHMRDPGLKKNFFSAPRASVWSKKKEGGGQPTGPSPGSATESHRIHSSEQEKKKHKQTIFLRTATTLTIARRQNKRQRMLKGKSRLCQFLSHFTIYFPHVSYVNSKRPRMEDCSNEGEKKARQEAGRKGGDN